MDSTIFALIMEGCFLLFIIKPFRNLVTFFFSLNMRTVDKGAIFKMYRETLRCDAVFLRLVTRGTDTTTRAEDARNVA